MMDTEKLYYRDVTIRTFTATVVECLARDTGFDVVLDATAFYPEGGGQPFDTGTLNGIPVTDVHEKNGVIAHRTAASFAPGTTVTGIVDDCRRRDLTEQHSGEHVVSGLIHARWGYENIGFHMGADVVTLDFSGILSAEDLAEIEQQANRYIRENREVVITWPSPEELEKLTYRSKKALTGKVRIVEFPGADVCACCGTHVLRTGEIGLVKFLSLQHRKGGSRVEMLAGERALRYFDALMEQNRQISNLLSARPLETFDAVRQLQDTCDGLKIALTAMRKQQFTALALQYAGAGNVLLFQDGLDSGEVRELCDAVMNTCGGRCAVFSGSDDDGYKYAVGQKETDLRARVKQMNAALNGRGGGKDAFFAQGSVKAGRAQIEAFFA